MNTSPLQLKTFVTVCFICSLFLSSTLLWAESTDLNDKAEKQDSAIHETVVIPEFQLTTGTLSGPGDFLDSLLHTLNKQSVESKNTFEQLYEVLPSVLPDLKKVYLTL